MTIELSNHEVSLIDKALTAYEQESHQSAVMTSMLGAILAPREERENVKREMEKDLENGRIETEQRKRQCILLRAKIIQAQSKASEHEVT